ncbi:unnamed protein product [Staurois parvus]|uniref:Uncharacterized protein n=1 Tax=Staurois parvus TaxID=386267 RepID=A0ABN9DYY9_9NEOB|nr:unnamed protein product [Staurois parvus]
MAARMQTERKRNDCFYILYGCKSNHCKEKKKSSSPPTSSTVSPW